MDPKFLECKKCECRFHISSFDSEEESICKYCKPKKEVKNVFVCTIKPKEKTNGFRG